jgi:hypothetical protein
LGAALSALDAGLDRRYRFFNRNNRWLRIA